MTFRRWIVAVCAVVGYAMLWSWLAAALFARIGGAHMQDLSHYLDSAHHVMAGQVPYRDFAFEYPPLALLPITLPGLFCRTMTIQQYGWFLVLFNAAWSCGIALCVWFMARRWMSEPRALAAVGMYLGLTVLGAAVFPFRFDLFPTLLTALALLLAMQERPALSGVALGLGIATKLYPVVLAPVLAARWMAAGDRRATARFALATAGVALAAMAPFLIAAPHDFFSFLRYHQQRGLQIESVAAGRLMLRHAAGNLRLGVVENFGAIHLQSPAASAVLPFLLPAFALCLGGLTLLSYRCFRSEVAEAGRSSDATLAGCAAMSLLIFLFANKVLSPQYLAWLLPFVSLVRWPAYAATVAATVLTVALFPFNYGSLVGLETAAIAALNARNLLLALAMLWLVLTRRSPWTPANART
ncbi:MAG TPA: glycosyltransferase 87 family protein [Gemmatimonadaceae bacterium]